MVGLWFEGWLEMVWDGFVCDLLMGQLIADCLCCYCIED